MSPLGTLTLSFPQNRITRPLSLPYVAIVVSAFCLTYNVALGFDRNLVFDLMSEFALTRQSLPAHNTNPLCYPRLPRHTVCCPSPLSGWMGLWGASPRRLRPPTPTKLKSIRSIWFSSDTLNLKILIGYRFCQFLTFLPAVLLVPFSVKTLKEYLFNKINYPSG